MYIYVGKLNWFGYAQNELITVVFPAGFSHNDPVYAYWQWTVDGAGNKKTNCTQKSSITSTTKYHIDFSCGYYAFGGIVSADLNSLSLSMSCPQGDTAPVSLSLHYGNAVRVPSTSIPAGKHRRASFAYDLTWKRLTWSLSLETGTMSTWISAHGAGAIKTQGTSFTITAGDGGSLIQPTDANKLRGSVLLSLPGLPQNASSLTTVAVDFYSQTAIVDAVVIMSGCDRLFRKENMGKTGDFTYRIHDARVEAGQYVKGLALLATVEFDNIYGKLKFQSAGLEVAVAREGQV